MKILTSIYTYGGIPRALFEAMILELGQQRDDVEWQFAWPPEDALISRARSSAAQIALESDADVWMQVDHDIAWRPGELAGVAEQAFKTRGIVAGLYPLKRPDRLVFPFRPIGSGELNIGEDRLIPATMVSTGFMAVHIGAMREAVEKLKTATDPELKINHCTTDGVTGWWDVFRILVRPQYANTPFADYQSEDWAFCERLRSCGVPVHAWSKPLLTHYGPYGFSAVTLQQKA